MKHTRFKFSHATTDYFFNGKFSHLKRIVNAKNAVIITDKNVFRKQPKLFIGWKCIVIKAGEKHKTQTTVDEVISQLIKLGADRKTVLIGVGGGVVTDVTGYVASVYLRGVSFGFIPTSILAMVDAGIGGKNGVDVGIYKNMVGTIRQPQFILYDTKLLQTLPVNEWRNGFAEIIKHACILDAGLFRELEVNDIKTYQNDRRLLNDLIERNARLKTKVVQRDEFENGDRRLLNFGHTLGHALENQYQLLHGFAVSIGMVMAAKISTSRAQFKETPRLVSLLKRYGLPAEMDFDRTKAFENLTSDKKRINQEMNFVILEKIGRARVMRLPFRELRQLINQL